MLIPAATLEDFPADLSDYDACSLLAAWTVLWHPHLVAASERIPAWYRADSPPDPKPGLLFVVPAPSLAQLPADFQSRVDATDGCRFVTGATRAEMWAEIKQIEPPTSSESAPQGSPGRLSDEERSIEVADFYAAGYACLQIQVMTRRLRYTSNLDEIHLQNRAVDAAQSFQSGKADEAIAALHDVFDALAEERDHYFSSSDPHLIDLTLVSPTTIDTLLEQVAQSEPAPPSDGVLETPANVLIDQDVAKHLGERSDDRLETLRQLIADRQIGWAGGGPSEAVCLDRISLPEAERAVTQATEFCTRTIGVAPVVFARFSGGWAGDLNGTLAALGYEGVIPVDFARGTGHGDEAKVLLETSAGPMEALTAQPIDASSDSAFLNFGVTLGESIDGGEIATALLAHWPGQSCDSFDDVRRAATWSLCLGRFWRLQDYFREGESPYHHGTIKAASKAAGGALEVAVEAEQADPISTPRHVFCQSVRQQHSALIAGLADLVHGSESDHDDPLASFATAVVGSPSGTGDAQLLVNPASMGRRETLQTPFAVSTAAKHCYACSGQGSSWDVTVDVPACGFVLLAPDAKVKHPNPSLASRLRHRFSGGARVIASKDRSEGFARLQNEFMEVVISPTSGGVSGVYSGSERGNRFSMMLLGHRSPLVGQPTDTIMQCTSIKTAANSAANGVVVVNGQLVDVKEQRTMASFSLEYQLARGSRVLQVNGELSLEDPLLGSPWQNYVAVRSAVSGESAIHRPIIRDKVHRRPARNLVAPLGVVIDEAERQTLVATYGSPYHRIVGERFLDTLLQVQGETETQFSIAFGFDVPAPVAIARSLISPTESRAVDNQVDSAAIGWVIHTSPNSLEVSRMKVGREEGGQLTARLQLVQTRPQPCTASLRFLRDVESAVQIVGRSMESKSDSEPATSSPSSEHSDGRVILEAKGDRVVVALPAHGIAELEVVFCD